MGKITATKAEYDGAWLRECEQNYPAVAAVEDSVGIKVDGDWLRNAARVLACPVKINPPNWQHGRVLYSLLRAYLADTTDGMSSVKPVRCLDIGTAKGFSAVCMARAALDAGRVVRVTSIDVIDPDARTRRNTVAEVDGLRTLPETLSPWPDELALIDFVLGKGENWFVMNRKRIHFAFVDGKHAYESVKKELAGLSGCQERGDIIVCDDMQVPGVARAVDEFQGYSRMDVKVLPERAYAVLVRL